MAKTGKAKAQKGEFGYFKAAKKRQAFITLTLFAVPLFIFFSAWYYNKTRMTVWTVVGTVGCIPACKSAVTLIMYLLRKPMKKDIYDQISSHAGNLTMAYEMYMTFYEKSGYLDAVVICGNQVVGYTSDSKVDTAFLETEAQKIVRKNGYKATVKILKDIRPYLERLDSMNEHQDSIREGIKFNGDERYPGMGREDIIKQTILAICL